MEVEEEENGERGSFAGGVLAGGRPTWGHGDERHAFRPVANLELSPSFSFSDVSSSAPRPPPPRLPDQVTKAGVPVLLVPVCWVVCYLGRTKSNSQHTFLDLPKTVCISGIQRRSRKENALLPERSRKPNKVSVNCDAATCDCNSRNVVHACSRAACLLISHEIGLHFRGGMGHGSRFTCESQVTSWASAFPSGGRTVMEKRS